MKKIICIDLRPLQIGHQNRGIGMMIKSILKYIDEYDNDYLFYMFDKNSTLEELGISTNIKNYRIIQTPTLCLEVKKPIDLISSLKVIFHRYVNLKKFKPDIFIQFDFTLGFPRWKRTKAFLIAFDLIPLIMKNEYLPSPIFAFSHTHGKKAKIKSVLKAIYYNFKYKLYYSNYKKCHGIISISKSTTRSFIDRLGINTKKITTIPLAPVSQSNNFNDKILSGIKKPYIFYIGGTDSRKRIDHIVFAYNIVRSRGYDLNLVFAGSEFRDRHTIPDNAARDAITASPYKKDMYFLGFISDEEKYSLYKNAHAFVFCSMYEGYGLPIVEAELNSCPVVSYNNSSIPEAAGDAALLVESGDYEQLAYQVIKLFDKNLRSECVKKGIRHTNGLSWKKYVDKFINTIEAN